MSAVRVRRDSDLYRSDHACLQLHCIPVPLPLCLISSPPPPRVVVSSSTSPPPLRYAPAPLVLSPRLHPLQDPSQLNMEELVAQYLAALTQEQVDGDRRYYLPLGELEIDALCRLFRLRLHVIKTEALDDIIQGQALHAPQQHQADKLAIDVSPLHILTLPLSAAPIPYDAYPLSYLSTRIARALGLIACVTLVCRLSYDRRRWYGVCVAYMSRMPHAACRAPYPGYRRS